MYYNLYLLSSCLGGKKKEKKKHKISIFIVKGNNITGCCEIDTDLNISLLVAQDIDVLLGQVLHFLKYPRIHK